MKTNHLETHGRDWPILLGITMACLWTAPRPVVADALPKWVRGQLGPDEFVGVSSEQEDEDAALREALTNAQVQVAQSLGMMLDTLSLQESSDEGNGVTGTTHYSSTDKTQASTRTLLALKAEQRHVEKQCPRGEPCRWKAWVLVRYSSAGHRQAMRRRIDEAIDAVRDLALAGLESIRNDDWASALQLFGKLDQPGQELEALTGVDSGDLAELRREREAARRKVQAILSTLHLNANPTACAGTRRHLAGQKVSLTLTFGDENPLPVVGLPISVRVLTGHVQTLPVARTDSSGATMLGIERVLSRPSRVVLELKPDLGPIAAWAGSPGVLRVELTVVPDTVDLRFEGSMGSSGDTAAWKRGLGQGLTKRGFRLESEDTATLRLLVVFETQIASPSDCCSIQLRLEDDRGATLWNWTYPDGRFRGLTGGNGTTAEEFSRELLFEWIAGMVDSHS